MKFLVAIAVVAVIGVFGAIGFAYSGLYDVSASSPHSGFAGWQIDLPADRTPATT